MRRSLVALGVLLSALTASACADAIYLATSTSTAIELNAGEGGQAHAQVGYRRQEALVAPMGTSDGKVAPKAPSTLALYDMRAGSLTLGADMLSTHLKQVFATGRAAKEKKAMESAVKTMRALETGEFSRRDR